MITLDIIYYTFRESYKNYLRSWGNIYQGNFGKIGKEFCPLVLLAVRNVFLQRIEGGSLRKKMKFEEDA